MITTCTLNPAIDYHLYQDQIEKGKLNRVTEYSFDLGGKGINVSKSLNQLACKSRAITILNPELKLFYKRVFKAHPFIKADIVKTQALIRFNVKMHARMETEINTQSEQITAAQIHQLIKKVKRIKDTDMMIFSGSCINNEPYLYDALLTAIKDKDVDVIIDIPAILYDQVLKHKPLLVKPNQEELKDYFNLKDNPKSYIPYCRELINKGAQNIILSLGKSGSLFVNSDQAFRIKLEPIKTNDTVGAGDAFVAGFAFSYNQEKDVIKAYQFGHSTAHAYVMHPQFHINDVYQILKRIDMKEIIDETI